MKEDIDRLMEENEVDALWVTGSGQQNPAMVYMTGGIEVSRADYIKIAGAPPVLFHSPIERDGAVKAGVSLISYAQFPLSQLIREAGGNTYLANAYLYRDMFAAIGLQKGKVAVYGEADLGRGFSVIANLKRFYPSLDFEIHPQQDVIRKARAVKSAEEIEQIRQMGKTTVEIVDAIAGFLKTHTVKNENLIKADGSPLTIADVKTKMRMLLAEHNVLASGTIFAIGRDAGVPHNEGTPESILSLGQTIIFDAFFQEAGGGYWYDFTRTWCLGYAPDNVKRFHEQVAMVHRQVAETIREGDSFHRYQLMACEMFADWGHATIEDDPMTMEGYVHGLGHGVGLDIHELPSSGSDIPENILEPGMVITIEPGLYYPDHGFGIRIEDTYVIDQGGKARKIVDYPWELVLPISGN